MVPGSKDYGTYTGHDHEVGSSDRSHKDWDGTWALVSCGGLVNHQDSHDEGHEVAMSTAIEVVVDSGQEGDGGAYQTEGYS